MFSPSFTSWPKLDSPSVSLSDSLVLAYTADVRHDVPTGREACFAGWRLTVEACSYRGINVFYSLSSSSELEPGKNLVKLEFFTSSKAMLKSKVWNLPGKKRWSTHRHCRSKLVTYYLSYDIIPQGNWKMFIDRECIDRKLPLIEYM